ncbi:hypothetical protein OHB12_03850 [Nocardia sp. NBC_01730]|uniref:hypothetical protein n=1 Tax=Nocardia sp. NBC_01730 TaxID=2975998 RepID=UPI002E14118D|nr:hypothetical protein OHB12_03850 [Nocardia sp. NBC_01730]
MARLRGAVGRGRSAGLLSCDTVPAGITVTNLGELGIESMTGVIPPPDEGRLCPIQAAQRPTYW